MPVTVVVGGQYGSEGKGKVCAQLALMGEADYAAGAVRPFFSVVQGKPKALGPFDDYPPIIALGKCQFVADRCDVLR